MQQTCCFILFQGPTWRAGTQLPLQNTKLTHSHNALPRQEAELAHRHSEFSSFFCRGYCDTPAKQLPAARAHVDSAARADVAHRQHNSRCREPNAAGADVTHRLSSYRGRCAQSPQIPHQKVQGLPQHGPRLTHRHSERQHWQTGTTTPVHTHTNTKPGPFKMVRFRTRPQHPHRHSKTDATSCDARAQRIQQRPQHETHKHSKKCSVHSYYY